MTTNTTPQPLTAPAGSARPDLALVERALARRSVAVLATVSPAGRPHAATVVYARVDGALYVSTSRTSRKARNVAANPHVHVCVAVRRLPFGPPPSSVQFATTAELLAVDHPDVVRLTRAGALKAITSHGELDLPDGCILRLAPPRTYLTYGLGLSLKALGQDPLHAGGRVSAG